MMVERYPNLKEKVGGLMSDCEISLLDGQLPLVLWCWLVGLLYFLFLKKKKKKKLLFTARLKGSVKE